LKLFKLLPLRSQAGAPVLLDDMLGALVGLHQETERVEVSARHLKQIHGK
jgi:hypothetical protein